MEKGLSGYNPEQCKIIACATVMEEMLSIMPPEIIYETLEFGLHMNPAKLKQTLQKAIDAVSPSIKIIILGYGLCSQAVVGLSSPSCTLIIPKRDDCIAIFLGSAEEYNQQHKNSPGTLYMTKGWIKAGNLLDERETLVKRYGISRAQSLFKKMIQNYTRLVFIDTGNYEIEHDQTESKHIARELDLQYEEIKGSNFIIKKMIYGPIDEDFVIVPPGQTASFLDFRQL
jgi:hypothetical protein